MQKLFTEDLSIITRDMLTERAPSIGLLLSGSLYLAELQKTSDALTAALQQEVQSLPFAQELADLDARHDELGRAVAYVCDAHAYNPLVTPATRERAERIRAALVPSIQELSATYVEEAALAVARAPKLETLRADLEAFPVADGATLFDWASAFIQAGLDIERLLSQRTTQKAAPNPRGHNARAQALSLLYRLRRTLREELNMRADLPRDLEARVFAHLDSLSQRRERAATASAPTPPAPEPTQE
jgi:hypothetical protein